MSSYGLPPATTGDHDVYPLCPWCKKDPGEATFTLAELIEAQGEGLLAGFINREPNGLPPAGALVGECPHCVRPFAVRIQSHAGWRFARLIPVRTPIDVKFAERKP